jgi:RloB-like protein
VLWRQTEKQYLDGLRRHFRDSPVRLVVRPEVGAPSQLVEHAAKLWQRDKDGFDEVWCVFDVDEFGDDIATAVTIARRAKILLAISNPCFEFWLLLHFCDHTAWLNGAAAAKTKLCGHLAGYDKTKLDFAIVASGVAEAIGRGRRLTESGRTHADNPSTTMWRLAATMAGE